jgi:hypothetical protein
MLEQALQIAHHVGHPGMIAAFSLLIAAFALTLLLRKKRPVLGAMTAVAIVALGAAPFAASTILHSRGVYHVHLVVLRPDQSPVEFAKVKSSTGGELTIVEGGWQLDIPAQTRPADGKVTFSAYDKDEFLSGKSTLVLAQDYYPTATIQAVAETSAMLRGIVVDEGLRAIAGATVSIEGNRDVAVTDQKGNFVLHAHAGNGQTVEVEARKGRLTGHLSAPAGKPAEIIIE